MKRFPLFFLTTLSLLNPPGSVLAANAEAGKATADAVCSSCHGIQGISASGAFFPNLAGQKEGYLKAALTAYRDGSRKAPVMNGMAANLSDADIENLAAHFAGLKACP